MAFRGVVKVGEGESDDDEDELSPLPTAPVPLGATTTGSTHTATDSPTVPLIPSSNSTNTAGQVSTPGDLSAASPSSLASTATTTTTVAASPVAVKDDDSAASTTASSASMAATSTAALASANAVGSSSSSSSATGANANNVPNIIKTLRLQRSKLKAAVHQVQSERLGKVQTVLNNAFLLGFQHKCIPQLQECNSALNHAAQNLAALTNSLANSCDAAIAVLPSSSVSQQQQELR